LLPWHDGSGAGRHPLTAAREPAGLSAPKRRGFGSTVVDSMAKLSVGGEVQLDYDPSGLKWRLTCQAANPAEPLGD
jgi:two-component sensor histidine kinase